MRVPWQHSSKLGVGPMQSIIHHWQGNLNEIESGVLARIIFSKSEASRKGSFSAHGNQRIER